MVNDARLNWLRKKNYYLEKARIQKLISKLNKESEDQKVEKLQKQLQLVKIAEKKPDEEEEIDSRLIEEDLDEADKERPKKRKMKKKSTLKSPLPIIKEEDAEHNLSSRSNIKTEKDPNFLIDHNIVEGNSTGVDFAKNISPFQMTVNPTYVRGNP